MTVLGVYDPPECDAEGFPLNWESCRPCRGLGAIPDPDGDVIVARTDDPRHFARPPQGAEYRVRTCAPCEGHGSLKAAALARRWDLLVGCGYSPVVPPRAYRCMSCYHPMSEGTWEHGTWTQKIGAMDGGRLTVAPGTLGWAYEHLRRGNEPPIYLSDGDPSSPIVFDVHYSPCDEGCRHGGPVRGETGDVTRDLGPWVAGDAVRSGIPCEASWRPVDVRTLGWPHDLRPEKLAVLCLRCWAAL